MIKKIKKHGCSNVIILDRQSMEYHGLETGDFVDISDIIKIKKKTLTKSNRR